MFRGLYSERLTKLARRGDLGYPVATIAFYGPTASQASKLVISIVPSDDPKDGLLEQRKWFSDTADLRFDAKLAREALDLIAKHGAKSVAMPETIIGCPHEEGTDYPEGSACPQCPFWNGRDRFAGSGISTSRGGSE
jgi:hypothetical protein